MPATMRQGRRGRERGRSTRHDYDNALYHLAIQSRQLCYRLLARMTLAILGGLLLLPRDHLDEDEENLQNTIMATSSIA